MTLRASFVILFLALLLLPCDACRNRAAQLPRDTAASTSRWDPFLDTLQERTIRWFLDVTPVTTGLTPDRWPAKWSPSSIAAVGFALTTYPIAAEHAIITRAEAAQRTLATLRTFRNIPVGSGPSGVGGYKGFFYHFLKNDTFTREWNCELSTIDTGLLFAGILFCQTYFDGDTPEEAEIRSLADSLYRGADWQWAMGDTKGIVMGWTPEKGYHDMIWHGYNEAMIVYILALGSPTSSVPSSAWNAWTSSYLWKEHYGQTLVNFMPLFGHQYTHCWVDFRGIQDSYMCEKKIDYFENSRRATYVHQAYAIANPHHWLDYSDSIWGMTACDGPKDTTFTVDGISRLFRSYSARGSGADEEVDDGTLAPTATAGSSPFAPELCIPALKAMRAKYGDRLWTNYGFLDAFNPTYITPETPAGWFDTDYLGIDQGPIVVMLENLRNEFVWNVMKKNPYIRAGLKKAGFAGGWLDGK